MDSFFGKCDAYCVVEFRGRSERTQTVEKNYNPRFEETFSFGFQEGAATPGELRISIYDWNRTGKDDLVGETLLTQERMVEVLGQNVGWKIQETLMIRKPDKSGVVKGHDNKECEVTIVLAIVRADLRQLSTMARQNSFAHRKTLALPPDDPDAKGKKRIKVTVMNGKHMPKMDTFGSADPMCTVKFQGQEHTTQAKKGTYEPTWDESFWYLVDDVGANVSELKVEVLDYNMTGAPDPIGNIRILPEDMQRIVRAPAGWQGEGTFDVRKVKNEAEVVKGKDKQNCYVSLRVLVDEGCNGIPPPAPADNFRGGRRVQVTVKSARHLPKMDTFGSVDPYCVVRFASQEHKTSVIKNSYQPEWEEANTFAVEDAAVEDVGELRVVVMDWDRGGKHDQVGSVVVSPAAMQAVLRAEIGWEGHGWYDVLDDNAKVVIGNDKEGCMLAVQLRLLDGMREIKLPAAMEGAEGQRRLQVCVVSARHLPKMDNSLLGGGTCDPYVVASMGAQQHTTSVKTGYAPDWGETVTFLVEDCALPSEALQLQLMEWNRLSAHEHVGRVLVPAEHMAVMARSELGWEGEGTYDVVDEAAKDVLGFDGRQCELTIKVRTMAALGPLVPPPLPDKKVAGQRSLELTVVSARHLPRMDGLTGSCDPYCVVRFAEQEHKTTTKKNTLAADWEETLWFVVEDVASDPGELELVVMDWDRMGQNDQVGSFVIPTEVMLQLMRADVGWEGEGTYCLTSPDKRHERVVGNDGQDTTVVIRVKLLDGGRGLQPPPEVKGEKGARRIEVTVVWARNLPKMDVLGSCDAYVVLRFGGDEKTSSVKKGSYAPEWEEQFVFYVDDVSKTAHELQLLVLDWDMAGSHDEVGQVLVPVKVMAQVMKAGVGWEGEGTYEIWDRTTKRPVYGTDGERSVLKIRARVLGALSGLDATEEDEHAEGQRRLEKAEHIVTREWQDTFGSCDPFVVASLGSQEQQTSVKKGVYSASWTDELLRFYRVDVAQPAGSDLLVRVMDWDRMGDNEEVGQVVIPAEAIRRVCRCQLGWEGEVTFNVVKEGSMKEVVGRDHQPCTITLRVRITGEAQLAPPSDVQFDNSEKLLEVSVLSLRHLPKMDALGSCDAYCVVHFEGQEFRTSTKKATYSPDWLDEAFVFHVQSADGTVQDLRCLVFDWDRRGADDKIGDVVVPGAVMSRVVNAPGGWRGEGTYYVCTEEGEVVVGKDKEACCLRLRVQVVGASERSKELQRLGSGLTREASKGLLQGLQPPSEEEIAALDRAVWGWPRVVRVTVVQAWGVPKLRAAECNPSCTVIFEGEEVQTSVVRGSSAPQWTETIRFVVYGDPIDADELIIALRDMDLNAEEDVGLDVGEAVVPRDIMARVMGAPDGWEGEGAYAFAMANAMDDQSVADECAVTIRVSVQDTVRGLVAPAEEFRFVSHPTRMWIEATVVSASHVPREESEEERAEGFDLSSYCAVAFAGQTRRTTTRHRTPFPTWSESFWLLADADDANVGSLRVALMAWNRFGFHQEIGEAVLPTRFMQLAVEHGEGWKGEADATLLRGGQVCVTTGEDGKERESEVRFSLRVCAAHIPPEQLSRAHHLFAHLDAAACGLVAKDAVERWLREEHDYDPADCFALWDGPWFYYAQDGIPFAGFLEQAIQPGCAWLAPHTRRGSFESSIEYDPWGPRQPPQLFGNAIPRWRRLNTTAASTTLSKSFRRVGSQQPFQRGLPTPELVCGGTPRCKRGAEVVLLNDYAARHGIRRLEGLVGILHEAAGPGKWTVLFPKVEIAQVVHVGAQGEYGLAFAASLPGLQWAEDDATKRWERERESLGREIGQRKDISAGLEPYDKIRRGAWGIAPGGRQQVATARGRGRAGGFAWGPGRR